MGCSRPVRGSTATGRGQAADGCCGRCGSSCGTALLVIAFRGITAIVFSSSLAPAGGTGTGTGEEFPVSLAEAYATEFGRVYLGFTPQNPGQREQALAAFVPASVSAANPSLGWNGIGQLDLQSVQVAGIRVQDPQHAVVTLLALLNGQLMELGVPVAATGSGLVVSAEPAGCPRRRRLRRRRGRAVRIRWPRAS